jgi:hypothetical protein
MKVEVEVVGNYALGLFGTQGSQPLSIVFRKHAFQTAKWCVFFKKNSIWKLFKK